MREIAGRNEISKLPIFQLPRAPGYGITAAFTEVDIPYAAIMGAAAAAESEARALDTSRQGPFCFVHFPVVVTEAPLFVCSLGKNNTPEIERVDTAVLAWRNPSFGSPHCFIHVVQASAIDAFANQTMSDFEFLMCETESEMKKAKRMPDRHGSVVKFLRFWER